MHIKRSKYSQHKGEGSLLRRDCTKAEHNFIDGANLIILECKFTAESV